MINRCEDNIDNILMQYKSYTDNIQIADIVPSYLSSTYLRSNINNRRCFNSTFYCIMYLGGD